MTSSLRSATCDRCKGFFTDEKTLNQFTTLRRHTPVTLTTWSWDLCPRCFTEFRAFLAIGQEHADE